MSSLIFAGGFFAITNRAVATFVYKLEYDAVTNQFVVTQPSKSLLQFGKPMETVLELKELKMLTKGEMEANKDKAILSDCVYYNGKNGQLYATVGRGIWYNQGLFLYLLQRQSRK